MQIIFNNPRPIRFQLNVCKTTLDLFTQTLLIISVFKNPIVIFSIKTRYATIFNIFCKHKFTILVSIRFISLITKYLQTNFRNLNIYQKQPNLISVQKLNRAEWILFFGSSHNQTVNKFKRKWFMFEIWMFATLPSVCYYTQTLVRYPILFRGCEARRNLLGGFGRKRSLQYLRDKAKLCLFIIC